MDQRQIVQIIAKYDQERMGVGGSTGDSDTGEQSQANQWDRNPGESAINLETVIFEFSMSDSTSSQYKMLARKVCDHLSKQGSNRSLDKSDAEQIVDQV